MATKIFTCWADAPGGAIRRIEVTAMSQAEALRAAYATCPGATSMSCRNTGTINQEARHA